MSTLRIEAMERARGIANGHRSREGGPVGERAPEEDPRIDPTEREDVPRGDAFRDHPGPDPGPGARAAGSLPALRPGPWENVHGGSFGPPGDSPPPAAVPSRLHPARSAARNRVLLVDDEVDFRTAVAELLEHLGYEVVRCTSYGDAYGLLRSEPFHLLMTEIRLPQGDGISLLEEARQLNPSVRLMLHCSYRPIDLDLRAGHLGIELVWNKFSDLKLLLARMRSVTFVPASEPELVAEALALLSQHGPPKYPGPGARDPSSMRKLAP